jgi:hypothetical protein
MTTIATIATTIAITVFPKKGVSFFAPEGDFPASSVIIPSGIVIGDRQINTRGI